ncbi:MAG: hypothetical protein IT444_06185 [Phycisphaeraceae bacterium]|nr:hypothetical protein [Phycisphaeraceae bacterium]
MIRYAFLLSLTALSAFVTGCEDDNIRVEVVPKSPTTTQAPDTANTAANSSEPRIEWQVPTGWTAQPASGMRYAAFTIPGTTPNTPAELTVFQFPTSSASDSGRDAANILANVNRWRGQLHLSPTTDADLEREGVMFQSVNAVGLSIDLQGRMGESETSATPPSHRMLGAIIPRPGRVWFFKLTGPLDVITSQKESFDAFLRSIKIIEPGETASTAPPPAVPSSIPTWTTPTGWVREDSSTPPRIATFHTGDGDDRVEIAVTAFPGGVGKPLDNFNRWRQQVGLDPVTQIPEGVVQSFFVGENAGLLIYIVGAEDQPATMQAMGVSLVAHDNVTWVFKMTGSRTALQREKSRFEALVQSTKF